jgi:hypothetical protein
MLPSGLLAGECCCGLLILKACMIYGTQGDEKSFNVVWVEFIADQVDHFGTPQLSVLVVNLLQVSRLAQATWRCWRKEFGLVQRRAGV